MLLAKTEEAAFAWRCRAQCGTCEDDAAVQVPPHIHITLAYAVHHHFYTHTEDLFTVLIFAKLESKRAETIDVK